MACNSLWIFDFHNVVVVDDDTVDNFSDVDVDKVDGVVFSRGYDFTPSACNMFSKCLTLTLMLTLMRFTLIVLLTVRLKS